MRKTFQNAKIVAANVDPAVYHRQEFERGHPQFVMSRGNLMEMLNCASRWRAGFESAGSTSTKWGEAADCYVLNPEEFADRFIVAPETYPDSKTGEQKPWTMRSNFCKDWAKQNSNKIIVKAEYQDELETARVELLRDHRIAELLRCSKKQVHVMGEYLDADTKLVIPVKALIDLVPDVNSPFGNSLADYKTCRNAHPSAWGKSVFIYHYDAQAALYLALYTAATGEDRNTFYHVLQENFAPFTTARRMCSEDFMEIGRMKYLIALKHYAQCLARNKWPGYDESDQAINGWLPTKPSLWMMEMANTETPTWTTTDKPAEPETSETPT